MEEKSEDRLATQEIFGSKHDKPKQLEKMGSAKPRQHDFLWERNICKGSLHVIAGPADSGKTKVAAWIASAVSGNGIPHWPDLSSILRKGLVVICTTNSLDRSKFDLQLRALRSDVENIVYFDLESASSEENLRNLGNALQPLDRTPALIIFDGIPRIDKRLEAKFGLLFAQFAQDHDCAVLVTTTIDDKLASTPSTVVGRLTICNSASVVFVISKINVSEDQQNEEEISGLLRVKSTIGPRDEGFGFEIVTVQAEVNGGMMPAAVLEWNSTHIYGPLAKRKALQVTQKRYTQRYRAANFLREALMRGPMRSDMVIRLGGQAQIPEDTLRRAATDVGVIRRPQPGVGGGRGPDLWSLEGLDHFPEQDANLAGVNRGFVSPGTPPGSGAAFHAHASYQTASHPPVKDLFGAYAHPSQFYSASMQSSAHMRTDPQPPSGYSGVRTNEQTAKVADLWQLGRSWTQVVRPRVNSSHAFPPSQPVFKDSPTEHTQTYNHSAPSMHVIHDFDPTQSSELGGSRATTFAQTAKVADVRQPWQQSMQIVKPAVSDETTPPPPPGETESMHLPDQRKTIGAVRELLEKRAMQALEDAGR